MSGWATLERRFTRLTPSQLSSLVFLIAFAVRVAAVFATHQYADLERFELERVALSLAKTGVFGNPYAIPTGPTAHVSPGYPLILAAIFRLFGTGTGAEMVKQVFACACSSSVCALLPFAARALQLPAVAGIGAALFTALLPVKLKTETQGDWESPFAALGLILVLTLTVSAWHRGTFTTRSAIRSGIAWGVALLFVSAYLPLFIAFLLLGLFLAAAEERKRYLRYAATVCLCVAACLAPWAWRNWNALGSPVIGRDNSGIELRVSNNPYAGPSEERNFVNGVYHRYHPLQSSAEAAKLRDMGEIPFNRMAMAEARQWISGHPAQFLRLSLERFRWFWFFGDRRFLPRATLLGLYTVLAFIGLGYLYRRNRLSFVAIATLLLIVPLPNYLVHVGPKHRYPIDWLLVLLAAFTVWQWFPASRRSASLLGRHPGA